MFLMGVKVKDSFIQLAPHFTFVIDIVFEICHTWNRIGFVYYLVLLSMYTAVDPSSGPAVVCGFVPCKYKVRRGSTPNSPVSVYSRSKRMKF
jgi:hypothetical protein